MPHLLFCHGLPGSPADVSLLARANPGRTIETLDLLALPPDAVAPGFCRWAEALPPDGRVHLVGFSLGAMVALRLAAGFPERVERLTLISAAAPLILGDFLPRMAGQAVFRMAKAAPRAFRGLTAAQGALMRLAPAALIRAMFSGATGAEAALLNDPAFQSVLRAGLRASFGPGRAAYLAHVGAYVRAGAGDLAGLSCPVDLWHGSADLWAPPDMSEALARALGDKARLTVLPGAGHYSTLAATVL